MVEEVLERGPVAGIADCGQGGHEGHRERALGKDPAQVVGDPVGDGEGVGSRTRPEQRGLDHVPGEAGHPRQQGHGAENRGRTQHAAAAHARPPAGLTQVLE